MATNNIKLFGESLNTYPTLSDATKGLKFSDSQWAAGTAGNSGIKNSGFVPNTPVSSIALNTALRQASFGSYILGEILSSSDITNQSVSTDNLETNANTLSAALINYLSTVKKLITGDEKAYSAVMYDTTSQDQHSINQTFIQLNTDINDTSTKLSNFQDAIERTGTSVAKIAEYYSINGEQSSNTINEEFTGCFSRINSLAPVVDKITFDSTVANVNAFTQATKLVNYAIKQGTFVNINCLTIDDIYVKFPARQAGYYYIGKINNSALYPKTLIHSNFWGPRSNGSPSGPGMGDQVMLPEVQIYPSGNIYIRYNSNYDSSIHSYSCAVKGFTFAYDVNNLFVNVINIEQISAYNYKIYFKYDLAEYRQPDEHYTESDFVNLIKGKTIYGYIDGFWENLGSVADDITYSNMYVNSVGYTASRVAVGNILRISYGS